MNAHSQTVLLVEDSDDDAFFFERALKQANASAHLVRLADGREAVRYFEQASDESRYPGVIFLDLKLPGLSGFDVLKWLRRHKPSIEVVVLSGSELEGDIAHALTLGAREYVVKPISGEQVREILQSALSVSPP